MITPGKVQHAVIFGASSFSSLLCELLIEDSEIQPVGFCVDAPYLKERNFHGLDVCDFSQSNKLFDPSNTLVFVPVGDACINGLRWQKCNEALAMGFQLGSWISSRAIVPRSFVPKPNVMIAEAAIIQPGVTCGWNVIIRAGANIGHHSIIGDHVFIASSAVSGGNVTIGDQCWVGLGAVIRDGIQLAPRSFIGAGAVVVKDTEPDGVYVGVPARRVPGKTSMDVTT